nr:alkaline phosphatase family protein [Candidatus Baldrarchaeota archaeon]
MGRVFVLALDGLEYDLVKKWNLKNLMQKSFGKIKLRKEYCIKSKPSWAEGTPEEVVPYTPIVWASFITGLPPQKHKIKTIWTYGKILDRIRKLPLIRHIKGKRKLLYKIGLGPRVVNKRDLNARTIFDVVKPSIDVYVPTYSDNTELHRRLSKALSISLKEYEREIWKVHRLRERKVFENLHREWKLFMAYFDIADLMGHLHIAKRPQRLRRVYRALEILSLEIKRRIPGDTVFIVVSDHGMKPEPDGTGNHSDHAFYSLNIETDWKPSDITDFYHKIIEWCE